jgi:hypothetical protein
MNTLQAEKLRDIVDFIISKGCLIKLDYDDEEGNWRGVVNALIIIPDGIEHNKK